MDLFNLAAKISLDDGKFNEGIARAERAGKGLGSSLENTFSKIAGAAKTLAAGVAIKKVTDSIINLANATADAGDRIDKQSQVLGMSRRAYQEWDYILGQNGASIDAMGVSMKTLNSLILEGQEGSKEAKNAFAQLGLGLHEIETLDPEDQFEAVVRAFQKMPEGAKKSALAVKIFGRNGMDLLPLLNQSATSIDELRQRAQELGIIMSDDAVDASVKYGDTLDDLKRTFNALKYSVGAQLLPALTAGVEKVTQFTSGLMQAFQERGIEGAWDFLVDAFRNIRWPTAEEITQTLSHIWDGVKKAAKSILVLVFGEDEKGNITWPSAKKLWEKIKGGLEILWGGIQTVAGDILKLVFGEDEDGNIIWPTADEIGQKVREGLEVMWDAIQTVAGGIMKLIFGEDEDGGIKWPTAEELGQKVREGITNLWNGIQDIARNILVFVFGEDEDGGIKFPSAKDLFDKIGGTIQELWNGVMDFVKGLLNLPVDGIELPNIQKVINDIKTWWNNVVSSLGNLFIDVIPRYLQKGADNPSYGETFDYEAPTYIPDEDRYNPDLYSQAKGDWTVPFDNYKSLLHRNEMVLTASQARKYREGKDSRLDVSQLAGAIVGAIREGMDGATVNSYLSGRNVTDDVNRNTLRQLKARRFAT